MKIITRAGAAALMSGGLIAAGLFLGPSAHAETGPDAGPTSEVGVLSVWHYNYYEDYFYEFETCEARGWQMKYVDHVYGMVNWNCHRKPGWPKWSMDVLFSI
ncbi:MULTISPECIES: hypothetical protein [unclassified Microbacterium]|uniref:hypothetical protein n=1 Tax=unclassified Microbacterium TaxID=2609290 RepID=UPI0012FCF23B|nr:hypothetical protein [Microbacterium sp. MAH-37]MVQ41406.1 hypothetical protein [Microbacterium sp. MAH-37]